jgi:hypothetical protein
MSGLFSPDGRKIGLKILTYLLRNCRDLRRFGKYGKRALRKQRESYR